MTRALDLAWRGWGRVHPNPLVRAVVLSDGRPVGEGWHAEFGRPHAEVVALDAAGVKARGATLVVTLEPCAHEGKTPPCTRAILAAGIRRVVVAIRDPHPAARGGIELLRREGVDDALIDGPAQDAAQFDSETLWLRVAAQVQPGDTVLIVRGSDAHGRLITAVLSGKRTELSDAALLRLLATHPLLTLKVTAAIHWHALRLLAKRISWRPHPAAPEPPFSLGKAVTAHTKGPMQP